MERLKLNENKEVVPCPAEEWAVWFETADRRVGLTPVKGFEVSTVFIGSVKGLAAFETAIFWKNGSFVKIVDRYDTWDQAVEGHKAVVEALMQSET